MIHTKDNKRWFCKFNDSENHICPAFCTQFNGFKHNSKVLLYVNPAASVAAPFKCVIFRIKAADGVYPPSNPKQILILKSNNAGRHYFR